MCHFITRSPYETGALGAKLGEALAAGDIVLLVGDLGAGKSVLARGIARGLGIVSAMPSPTFTLMQPYRGRVPLYHFDLYRLNDEDEFYAAGLDECVGGDGVAVIEWPDQVGLAFPGAIRLAVARGTGEDERNIDLSASGMDAERIHRLLTSLAEWRAPV